jgi:hypothetical protein
LPPGVFSHAVTFAKFGAGPQLMSVVAVELQLVSLAWVTPVTELSCLRTAAEPCRAVE